MEPTDLLRRTVHEETAMSNAKPTPGPWKANGIAIEQGERPVLTIAHCCYDCDDWDFEKERLDDEEALANARLIAAAPEMLEALKFVQTFLKGNPHPEDEDSWAMATRRLMDRVNDAVAKAEG
jgi:hypothetical protein